MSTQPLVQIKESPSSRGGKGFAQGLPQTIDPLFIDNRHSYSGGDVLMLDTTIANAQLTSMAASPSSASRRTSLALDHQTPPNYLQGPLSASSSMEYSSASGFLSPYSASTSASTCSSRRESIQFENTQHYTLPSAISPSPQTQGQRNVNFDNCFLSDSFVSGQFGYVEPATLVEDEAQAYSYKQDHLAVDSNNGQWYPQDAGHAPFHRRALAEPNLPEYMTPNFYTNLGQTCQTPEVPRVQGEEQPDDMDSHRPSETSDYGFSRRPSLDEPFQYSSRSPSPRWSNQEFWESMSSTGVNRGGHRQKRSFGGVSKAQRRNGSRVVHDAGTYELEEKGPVKGQKQKQYRCARPQCLGKAFTRPEHWQRHLKTHAEKKEKLPCPLCKKTIDNRKDNLKAHITNTHFRRPEKKKTENMNDRFTMKQLFEKQLVDLVDEDSEAKWLEFFGKEITTGSREEVWKLVRGMDPRFGKLLANDMTIHDREKTKSDKQGECTGKLTRLWTMMGWSIAETQEIRVTDIAADWEGPEHATLWELDPRRRALEDGTLKLEDAEFLGVDMFESKEMGFEHCDPRWQTLHAGQMSVEDSEKYGVKHLNPQWTLSQSKRRRSER